MFESDPSWLSLHQSHASHQLHFQLSLTVIQVAWLGRPIAESSWESASSLPTSIVEEYERGIQRNVESNFSSSGGQTLCTITSGLKEDVLAQPAPKKPCLSEAESSNSG